MSGETSISPTASVTDISSEPLTREEEYRLAQLWREHKSQAAADRLVRAHLRYVVATANKYRRYGVPLDELIAEGNFGLAHALKKFEPDRGFRFVTYAAYWVRAYILNYIIRSWSMVGGGSGALRSKTFFKLRRERARIANLIEDREQQEAELADRMQVSREQLSGMLRRLESRDVSLDAKVFDDSGATLVDTLPDDAQDQETELSNEETSIRLESAVADAVTKLDTRERFIVEQRLMADQEERLSLAEIGRTLGVSRERARQLESRAKSKLRGQLLALSDDAKPVWLTPQLERQVAA